MTQHKFSIILGEKNRSSWSMRAWLMLKQTGVEFNEHIVKLYSPETKAEILKHSPSGKVPALIHGDNLLWESLAIGEYLAELFPDRGLWPENRDLRAIARCISSEMHSGFINLRTEMPFCLNEQRHVNLSPEAINQIKRVEQIWIDCKIKYSKDEPYLFNTFSIADAMFAPVVLRFRTYGIKLENKISQDYCQNILNNTLIQEWLADI